jgi:hypothetical protein
MEGIPVQSRTQGYVSSSPDIYMKNPFLGFASTLGVVPMVPAYMELLKDGRRLIMRPTKNDYGVADWLRSFVGVDVTVSVVSLGISWTSKLSYRKSQGYIYIRIPANLRKYFMPLWESGVAIPVMITIPPIALSTRFAEGVSYERQ